MRLIFSSVTFWLQLLSIQEHRFPLPVHSGWVQVITEPIAGHFGNIGGSWPLTLMEISVLAHVYIPPTSEGVGRTVKGWLA